MVSVDIHNRPVRQNIYFDDVLFDDCRVVEISLAIYELLKPRDHVLRNLALRFASRQKHERKIGLVT